MSGLHSVASAGRVREMGRILSAMTENGQIEKVNAFNRHGFTPLHAAIFHDHYEMVELLLKKGADASRPAYREQWTFPLHLASVRGTVRLIRILLNSGADPFLCDWDGVSAVQIAATSGNKHVATYLEQQMTIRKNRPINYPSWTAFNIGMKDTWWRTPSAAKGSLALDHFSDGGTPAMIFAELKLRSRPKLKKSNSQPLTRREVSNIVPTPFPRALNPLVS
jgi:hypothetical protein